MSPPSRAPTARATLVALALGAAACARPAPSAPGPNVLVLLWDTVRADRLGIHGEPGATPWLERFAGEATVYERAVAPGTWTVPSHASLFTGLPASAHGACTAYAWLNDEHETLAESFSAAGWETWAFSANPHVDPSTHLDQGFATLQHPWDEPWRGRFAGPDGDVPEEAFLASAEVAGEALDAWLDARDGGRPFFAFVNLMEAHLPRRPTPAARRARMGEELAEASRAWDAEPPPLQTWMLAEREASERERALVRGLYDASLFDLDRRTGAIVAGLERRGLLDDTLVVLTSDHGENLGEKRLYDHKFCAYDTLVHVPLVVRWPAGTPGHGRGARVRGAVSLLDVHATLLDAAGLPRPEAAQGRSLLGRDVDAEAPRPVFAELLSSMPQKLARAAAQVPDLDWRRWRRTFKTVERDGWKLIRSSEGERELYHVAVDPGEERDLSEREPGRVRELEALLDGWLATFRAFDPAVDGEPGRARDLPPQMREQLQLLGYYDPVPEDGGPEGDGSGRNEPDGDT